MIKTTIFIFALIVLSASLTYTQFALANMQCEEKELRSCRVNFYDNPALADNEVVCAQDYRKAQICFYTYKQCSPENQAAANDEMPVVCWQCFNGFDSESISYSKYQACLRGKGSSYLILSFALLLVMVFLA